jgi:hypothetical protein
MATPTTAPTTPVLEFTLTCLPACLPAFLPARPLARPPARPPTRTHALPARRKVYAGIVSVLDAAVANVTAAFQRTGMWEDTVLVFTTVGLGTVGRANGVPADACLSSLRCAVHGGKV